jgi:hypothetical protein
VLDVLGVGELQGVDADDAGPAAGLDDGADGRGRDDVILFFFGGGRERTERKREKATKESEKSEEKVFFAAASKKMAKKIKKLLILPSRSRCRAAGTRRPWPRL